MDSPKLSIQDNVARFDARLKKGGGVAGSVLTPDGRPAVGADVVLVEKGAATMDDGVLSDWAKHSNVSTHTDATGHFMLPARTGPIKLMLYHDTGWTYLKLKGGDSLENLKLRAWCTVEGKLMKGDKPWSGQTVWLRPTIQRGEPVIERQFFQYRVVTGADGQFTFTHVVDGTADVSVQVVVPLPDGRSSFHESHGLPINPKPGEKIAGIQIGGRGRPVIAHVIVSDELRAKGLIPPSATLSLARPPGFAREFRIPEFRVPNEFRMTNSQ